MIRKTFNHCFIALYFLFFYSCKTWQTVDYSSNSFNLKSDYPIDSALMLSINPYKDSVDLLMNRVIGHCSKTLIKEQPEGTLGNFVADALLHQSEEFFNTKIDFSIVNNGGIRIPSLPEGDITVGHIYELMPFDNMVALITCSGHSVKKLFNIAASKGGWPVSNATYIINKQTAISIFIGNEQLDTNKTYRFACSDYLANGGDGCSFLIDEENNISNILFRDMLIQHIESLSQHGQFVTGNKENRISSNE